MDLSVKSYSLERKIKEHKNSTFIFLLITARFTRKKLLESLKFELQNLAGVTSCDVLSPKSGVSLPANLRAIMLGCPMLLLEVTNTTSISSFLTKEVAVLQEKYKEVLPRYSQTMHPLLSTTAICKTGIFMDAATYLELESREGDATSKQRIIANIGTNRTTQGVISGLQSLSTPEANLQQQTMLPVTLLVTTLQSTVRALIGRKEESK